MKAPEERFETLYEHTMTHGSDKDIAQYWFLKGLELGRDEKEEE